MLRMAGTRALWPETTFTKWLIWLTTFTIATISVTTARVPPITLADIQFTQESYNATIPENSPGKTYVTPSSKMGIYLPENFPVKVTYQIIGSDDDVFKVEDFTVGDFSFLLVRSHSSSYGRFNRELRSEYTLKIKATIENADGAIHGATTDLIIYVSDLNDLTPLFDYTFYNISVREDTPLHTSIAQVSAYDGDEGINAQIYYSFVQKTNIFAVHPTSGVISLTRPLNYFLEKTYSIDVLAEDRGPMYAFQGRKRPATLMVNVIQVNFFSPDITITKLPSVSNDGQNEVVLAMVSVEDQDIGENGKVGPLEIVDGNHDNLLSLQAGRSAGHYQVKLVHSQGQALPPAGFNITLKATDKGSPPMTNEKSFFVSVLESSKGPQFTSSLYSVSVEEIAPVNTPLLFVSIGDFETLYDVRFEIAAGNVNNMFKIHPKSGLISTSSSLDAEKVSNVQLKVVLYNTLQKRPPTPESTTVEITIRDNNDNAPRFDIVDNVSEVYIKENKPVGSNVLRISAIDGDKNENGRVSFSLMNSKDVPFDIDPFTGEIKSTSLIDYETMRHIYKLNLRVSDWGTPFSRESEMVLTVNIQDDNDNQPYFEKAQCQGYLSRDAPVGTEVLSVPAIDFDISDIIHYFIDAGNEDNCFSINRESAKIFLNCSLKEVTSEKRHLLVIAKDGVHSSEPLNIEMTLVNSKQSRQLANSLVNIKCQSTDIFERLQTLVTTSRQNNALSTLSAIKDIETVSNRAPHFNSTVPTKLTLSEGLVVGTTVAKIVATDMDSGYNGLLVYVIKSGDPHGYFQIDMHSGALKILSKLDRETKDRFILVVEAADLGSPRSLITNISIEIKIIDENDNSPKFEQDEYFASISENIIVNSTVTQVSASDADLGDNALITYTIVSDTNHFSINPRNGIIVVNKALDREQHKEYKILVRASDKGEKQVSLSSTATVVVELTDINDVVPKFTPDVYNVRLREDIPVGAVITVVTASDSDEGKNGEVTYKLVYGEDYFEIDSETGVIRLIQKLDYEVQQIHNISIRAHDGGSPSLVSACFLNIEVVDVNENLQAPVFENFFAHGYVNENEPVGTTVMFVTAVDPDGADGMTYSIRDGTGLGRFSIDANGTITTSQVLDRETATHYWLTVYAQDHGLVPLHTRLEVYIEVKDTNDHIPLTFDPIYSGSVPENSNEAGLYVTQVEAFDLDKNPGQRLTYAITRYNSGNYFQIDQDTGIITTTGKAFDREKKAEFNLEVTVSDNGDPALTYETRVHVTVEDENDNRPEFTERLYRVRFPEMRFTGLRIPVFQVLASDADEGPNGELMFLIREDEDEPTIFRVHPVTGIIYSTADLNNGDVHHFVVRASDKGSPRIRRSTIKVRVEIVEKLTRSLNPPQFTSAMVEKHVMESDAVGHLVDVLQAYDKDGDNLYYSILAGDPDNQFYVGLSGGNLVVARPLDYEQRHSYNLTVQVTDGVHYTNCTVIIYVIDANDNRPLFQSLTYSGSFPESTAVGASLLKVMATDADNSMLIYSLPRSCNSATVTQLFDVNAETGDILVKSPLDREVATQHNLTVMVIDQGVNPHRNYTRVTINIQDFNDHKPVFLATEFRGRVFETAAIGTSVVMVMAVDEDKGQNAEITYNILSAEELQDCNVGGVFTIDSMLGTISVAKELNREMQSEYQLVVMATDRGDIPMSNTATVKIDVTISDNAPPKFDEKEYLAELHENQPWFTNVFTVTADCRSSVIYTIIGGNEKGVFAINPNSGVVYTKKSVDFEEDHAFNLTIKATSIIHSSAETRLLIHIIDENDNSPEFLQDQYVGYVTEGSKPGTIVLNGTGEPLVILATDRDTNLNALLTYEIRDDYAKTFITIDPNTGAIRTVIEVDHEEVDKIEFSVEVWDMGQPQQRTKFPAKVIIYVNDTNDSQPAFEMTKYATEVLLPTYKDVVVIQLNAKDPDTGIDTKLKYSITAGNDDNNFRIDPDTSAIYIINETNVESSFKLTVEVTDGLFRSDTDVEITVKYPEQTPIKFTKEIYEANVMENYPDVLTLTVIQVVGRALNEQYDFYLLNGHGLFEIGHTSGVLSTVGVAFDREENDVYNLVVEVRRETSRGQEKAHTLVRIFIGDENDNSPVFVHQPYHAVLVYNSVLGSTVKQVTAIDRDTGLYGEVTYRVRGRGDMDDKFIIDSTSGKITLKRPLKESDVGKAIVLSVTAEDKDQNPKSASTTVQIMVINDAYPVFDQQVYRASVDEHFPKGASVTSVSANSPTGQKLIYTIIDGDRYGDFDVDYNIAMDVQSPCLILVKGVLDHEVNPVYNLTMQATESFSGLTATAIIFIHVQDINNIAPSFTSLSYTTAVSEAVAIGTSIITVTAKDPESGANGLVHYSLLTAKPGSRDVDWFYIDSTTGMISSKKQFDREKRMLYSLVVEAVDSGVTPLSSTASVRITLLDLNDNAPVFDQPSYSCTITDQGVRGQLVTKVSATDPDSSSACLLRYAIIGGNGQQAFQMDEEKGIISLSSQRRPELYSVYELNISVSDGVFTNFARVSIKVQNSNKHAPKFAQNIYVAEFPENYGEGMLVTQVSARDEDSGGYGMLSYSIPSDEMKQFFRVDADSGEIFSVQVLDREMKASYSVPIAAIDNGGYTAYTIVHISIIDQNDNVPQFLAHEYKKTLSTEHPINATIMVIRAEDHDSGVNGRIVYNFAPGTSQRVPQMFGLDRETGEIILLKGLQDSANEMFQFFIQASDQGMTPMQNNVPVNMWVTSNVEAQPVFSQPSYSFFMLESDNVSTVIATVKATSTLPLEYSIIPGFTRSSNAPAKFGIDNSGRIHVASKLDMETTSAFTLTVQAQTISSRSLVQQVAVEIRLMDVNDNFPWFEANPYRVSIPENAETGIEVVRVVAHDNDKSSKFTYMFGDGMQKYSHQFGLDSSTGVITLLSPLDREEQEVYNLTVWVRDSDGEGALKNFTIVRVVVMDHNDNPPIFSKDHYMTAVNEDAYEGTILMTLKIFDKDLNINTETRFYITDGDPQGKFKIRRNGDLFVNRPLDREQIPRYVLTVVATDGGFVSSSTITVDILDANDNDPECSQERHYAVVNEDVSSSWVIARVKATDKDEYGSLHYELSGDGAEMFFLEPNSGVLTSSAFLDREQKDSYELEARAVDSGGRYCSMMVYISISDVNDNAPEFTPLIGPAMLSEDAELNTLVYRVSATDKDLGINRQVTYELKTDFDGTFKIDEISGLLQLAKPLDRETTSAYELVVVAKDMGSPQLSSEVNLDVVVLDVNDNPPEFEQTTYMASILESAMPATSVIQIQATSKDTGLNAKISYFIQAGNQKDMFSVDEETGVIRVAGELDREMVPGFTLTVRAQDHGEKPLSNTAYVKINVTDVNDNSPVFLQKIYSAKIREDVQRGSKVIQVLASDKDSLPENKAVNYSIQSGDHLNSFDIHPTDGTIVVRAPLDRETVSSYILHVRASNHHLFTDTMVNVEILDANDSPPQFTEDNYTVFIQEDKEITSCVLTFDVTDDDLEPNGAPFTFDIIKGDGQNRFRVNKAGELCIAGNLNRQVTATYKLTVRVFDNGTPAMYSDVGVVVNVIEESTYSPEVSNIEVSISSYLDEFPGGVIGTLKAVDIDKFDTLRYSVVSQNRNLFDIDQKDGRIIAFAGLDAGTYAINISVSDGKYIVYGIARVDVNVITEEMVSNSITLQIENTDPAQFVKTMRTNFQRILKRELNVRTRDIEIISIQKSENTLDASNRSKRDVSQNVDVLFAVKKGTEYIPAQKLQRKVSRSIPELEASLNVHILKVFSDVCEEGMCTGGDCVGYVDFDKEMLVPVVIDGGSFVSAKHRHTYECVCPNGNVGDNCLTEPTSCDQEPCPRYKLCSPHPEHGYQCVCPPGKAGRHCEKDLENKCDTTNCHRGDSPITFSGNSYAMWSLVEPIYSRLSLSLRIKTRKETATIMYAKGRVDYSILELIHGNVQYRFDCGSGEGLVIIPKVYVSDGKWHTIMVERHGNTAEIFLDGQYSAISGAPGNNDVLNLDTSDVYFGAEVEMYANGYIDVRKGYRGCIEDIRIYNVRLPVSGSNAVALSQDFKKVEFSCRDSIFITDGNNICSKFPCMNGGQCESTGPKSYICKCGDRFRGSRCEIDTDPCQRQPCLNNGKCENVPGVPNEFTCKCPREHKGRRCEYGKFCLPNPCMHGGTCVEAPSSYLCMCRNGFNGLRCENVVDICDSNPCQNNGACLQDGTSYTCNCSSSHSGDHCQEVVLPSIVSSPSGVGATEIYIIAGVAVAIILIVLVFVLVRVWRRNKRTRRRGNVTNGIANDSNEVYLNLLKDDKHQFKAENTLKVDNINNKKKTPPSPQPPPVPDRPASYTPSAHDSVNTLNNFDSLRNYGSAADELENIPNIPPYNMDYLQTFVPQRSVASIQPTTFIPPPPLSDTDSLQKEPWEYACQNILQNYQEKHGDKLSKMMPIGTVVPMSRLNTGQDTTSFSSLPISESEEDQQADGKKVKKGYHWDTSDWAPEKSLPNISEVPAGECPDSPASNSPHSNESNTHINSSNSHYKPYHQDAHNMDESEYVGDSEFTEHDDDDDGSDLPNYEEILAEQHKLLEDYDMPSHNYSVHPNYYLPLNSSFNSADGQPEEGWPEPPQCRDNDVGQGSDSSPTSSDDDNDSVLHYGFPPAHGNINRLSMITTDSDLGVDSHRLSTGFTTDDDGGYNRTSVVDDMSDISGLCEIEDSEVNLSESEDENTPLQTKRIHTAV